ncbi:hypothetical protein [Asaia astilbis]|nr:hypothetical protein [Asaia astilbis]
MPVGRHAAAIWPMRARNHGAPHQSGQFVRHGYSLKSQQQATRCA